MLEFRRNLNIYYKTNETGKQKEVKLKREQRITHENKQWPSMFTAQAWQLTIWVATTYLHGLIQRCKPILSKLKNCARVIYKRISFILGKYNFNLKNIFLKQEVHTVYSWTWCFQVLTKLKINFFKITIFFLETNKTTTQTHTFNLDSENEGFPQDLLSCCWMLYPKVNVLKAWIWVKCWKCHKNF